VSAVRAPFPFADELVPYSLGDGFRELVYGTSPAAAADFVQAIDGKYRTRLLSVFVRLVTDANAANREVVVEYRDASANRFMLSGAPVVVTATDTIDYAFDVWQGQAEWSVDDSVLVPLKPAILRPTEDFRIHVVNAQAGDQLSRIRFQWERFVRDE